jgi:hypothetical protein
LEFLKPAFFLLAVPAAAVAGFGPAEAAAHARRADFRVLVWYRRAEPLETFKYQVYDLRKGEYTGAVDTWIDGVRTKHREYIVIVRDVDLNRETGETESLKVGSVIERELLVAAAMAGVLLGGGPTIAPRPPQRLQVNPMLPPIRNDRSFLNPNPTPFPIPVPYPRPHP